MSTIWWVRHGPTRVRGMLGWSDRPADLSDRATLARLATALPDDAPVISSDLGRATATAAAIAGSRPRLQAEAALREISFGAWEGRDFEEIEAEEPVRLRAFWEQPGDIRPPEGESWNEITQRVNTAVDGLILRHERLVAVAHLGVILTQVQRALCISAYDAFAYHVDPLSVTRIRYGKLCHAAEINRHP